jgi:hypothetical protein
MALPSCVALHFQSAADALSILETERPVLNIIGDAELDAQLAPALNSLGIVEVYGPSGAGKSTLAMQIVATFLHENENCRALYLYSGKPFSLRRFQQIAETRYGATTDIQRRMAMQQMGDIETQAECISYARLALAADESPMPLRMIVVDTISANFRVHTRTAELNFLMYQVSAALHDFCYRRGAYVLCINEVAGVIGDAAQSYDAAANFSESSQNLLGDGSSPHAVDAYKPALGLSWSNCVTTRIEMSQRSRRDAAEYVGPERTLRVRRSPNCEPVQISCMLCDAGVQVKDTDAGELDAAK